MGTYVADMDIVSETTRFATGRSEANGGAGDSSVLTAFGVFQGQRAAAQHLWGRPTSRAARSASPGSARSAASSPGTCSTTGPGWSSPMSTSGPGCAQGRAPRDRGGLRHGDPRDSDIDVYAPCALGGALDDTTVEALRATVVCGGANNQLVVEGEGGTADRLRERGITYAPDFLVNAGGVIQVSDELHGFDFERAKKGATAIFDHTLEVLETADARDITPAAAADHIAEERMAAGQAGGIWLPAR